MHIAGFHQNDDRDLTRLACWICAAVIVVAAHAGVGLLTLSINTDKSQIEEPPIVMLVDMLPEIANPLQAVDGVPPENIAEDAPAARQQEATEFPDKALPAQEPPSQSKSDSTNAASFTGRRSASTSLRVKKNASSAAPTSGGAVTPSTIPPSWRSTLLLHLNKYKQYPKAARQSGITGIVHLQFTMDRSGRVLTYQLLGSTGKDLLDKETVEMIKRASPLPRIPPEIAGDTLTLTVPVRFSLQ